jgi:hypothetical protein
LGWIGLGGPGLPPIDDRFANISNDDSLFDDVASSDGGSFFAIGGLAGDGIRDVDAQSASVPIAFWPRIRPLEGFGGVGAAPTGSAVHGLSGGPRR